MPFERKPQPTRDRMISIRVSEEEYADLEYEATTRSLSLSQLIRRALDEFLSSNAAAGTKKRKPAPARTKRAGRTKGQP